MKRTIDEMLQHISNFGEDDYVQLWIVMEDVCANLGINAKKMTPAEAEKLWAGMSELITKMLQNGFIAVDLADNGGYTAWPEQEPKQVLAEIRNKWVEAKGKFPDVGFIVWFNKVNKQPRQRKPKPV
jgi:hypothetical protein